MLFHRGPNPTADFIVTRTMGGEDYILLITRNSFAQTEPGKLALPGGFVDGRTSNDGKWMPGAETFFQAAVRELKEETGLDLSLLTEGNVRLVGIFDAPDRDPRNTPEAWTESHVYHYHLPVGESSAVSGSDDAEHAAWYTVNEILSRGKICFAFDHFEILLEHNFLTSL